MPRPPRYPGQVLRIYNLRLPTAWIKAAKERAEQRGVPPADVCREWMRAGMAVEAASIPLCLACAGLIGGAHAGPDAPWRPALPNEACGAEDHDIAQPA